MSSSGQFWGSKETYSYSFMHCQNYWKNNDGKEVFTKSCIAW